MIRWEGDLRNQPKRVPRFPTPCASGLKDLDEPSPLQLLQTRCDRVSSIPQSINKIHPVEDPTLRSGAEVEVEVSSLRGKKEVVMIPEEV